MASKKDKIYAKMGAPNKPMDWKKFDKLCAEQCTLEDIAYCLALSPDTIETRIREKYDCTFSELFEIKRRPGLRSLRNRTYQEAMKGNPTMLIWLEKKYKKKIDIASDAEDDIAKKCRISNIEITVVEDSEECKKERQRLKDNDIVTVTVADADDKA